MSAPLKTPPDTTTDTDAPARARPRWREIQLALEQDIRGGVFGAGERLPTESELAERFGVHRHTVRRAIHGLRERDILRVEQGSGIFVREPTVTYTMGRQTRLTTAIHKAAKTSTRRILSTTRVKADRKTALALAVPVGGPLARIETLRLVDGRPIALNTYYFPLPRFETIHKLIGETHSISESLRRLGVSHFVRRSLRVKAILPTAKDSDRLKVGRSRPLIDLISVNVDPDGAPIQLTHSRLVSAALDLVLEFGN
jgi:GntR family phosphonate transport system transcriptional regulator